MANNLFVSYDLMSPGQNYARITAAIEAIGGYIKVHYSLYYLHTNYTAEQVRNHIAQSMDSNDKLVVIDAAGAIGHNMPPSVWDVLANNWNR